MKILTLIGRRRQEVKNAADDIEESPSCARLEERPAAPDVILSGPPPRYQGSAERPLLWIFVIVAKKVNDSQRSSEKCYDKCDANDASTIPKTEPRGAKNRSMTKM